MAVAAKSARQEEEIRTYVSLWPSHILHPLPPQRQLHQHHHGRVVHKPSCYLDIVGGREMAVTAALFNRSRADNLSRWPHVTRRIVFPQPIALVPIRA